MKKVAGLLMIIVFACSCKQKTNHAGIEQFCKNQLPQWNQKLTYVIMTDIFSPPVCSRIYAYTNIAAYEALLPENPGYKSYAGKLTGLQALPKPNKNKEYCYPISSIIAFITVGQKLVFNGDAMKEREKEYLQQLDSLGISKELLDSSVSYGRAVGQHILAWANKDGYLQRTSYGGYIVSKQPGRWIPTPPDYMDAVENNWGKIRPLILDSVSQFRPVPPIPYDTIKGSAFYKEAYKVYDAIVKPNAGDSATAWYWDDNPNTSVTDGHITYFLQKNSPPGHWVHIACAVAEKENYDAIKTASLISKTAIALFDALISCWEAKYYYNYVRPETFINKYIDKDWQPLIQTPPFPEYPSGHSCISASAATVLTNMVGDHYAFIDSTEVPFGRPVRKFDSFYQAADQASISRMYGGIHFREALETGNKQGKQVGAFIAFKLNK
jgi:PAP2 superfamily